MTNNLFYINNENSINIRNNISQTYPFHYSKVILLKVGKTTYIFIDEY